MDAEKQGKPNRFLGLSLRLSKYAQKEDRKTIYFSWKTGALLFDPEPKGAAMLLHLLQRRQLPNLVQHVQ
jgi:hypothetical protein